MLRDVLASAVMVQSRPIVGIRARSLALDWAAGLVLLGSMLLHWFSAGDHALYSPDEGRYASASLSMADGGHWLVPMVQGEPHLTKPPLVYWMQAVSLEVFGHSELAVRFPSLLATSILTLLVFVAGMHMGGRRMGLVAAGLLACMPLHMVVGRMAIIDPVLAACWFGTLMGGLFAVQSGRWQSAAAMWLCVALGLLAKGPLALLPLVVIVTWLALAGRLRDVSRTRPFVGLPLAIAPTLTWAIVVARTYPEAPSIWLGQTAGRLIGTEGTNAHSQPIWYYVPVFVAGLFPATLLLALPGLNLRWRASIAVIRNGNTLAFWIIAVLLPLTFFTLMSGKLMTYLLPLTGPMALLGAVTLDRWLSGEWDRPVAEFKPVHFVWPLALSTGGIAVVAIGAATWFDHSDIIWTIPLLATFGASVHLARCWRNRPELRWRGLVVMWCFAVVSWACVFEIEDSARLGNDPELLVHRAQQVTKSARPRIAVFGYRDPTLEFYARRTVGGSHHTRDLQELLDGTQERLVLLVDDTDWTRFTQQNPKFASIFARIEQHSRWFRKTTDVLLSVLNPESAGSTE